MDDISSIGTQHCRLVVTFNLRILLNVTCFVQKTFDDINTLIALVNHTLKDIKINVLRCLKTFGDQHFKWSSWYVAISALMRVYVFTIKGHKNNIHTNTLL